MGNRASAHAQVRRRHRLPLPPAHNSRSRQRHTHGDHQLVLLNSEKKFVFFGFFGGKLSAASAKFILFQVRRPRHFHEQHQPPHLGGQQGGGQPGEEHFLINNYVGKVKSEMKLMANGFVWKIAKWWWDLIFNYFLVVQDLWARKEARSSVKVTKAMYGWQQFHLPANRCWSLKDESSLQSSCQSWRWFAFWCAVNCTLKRSSSHEPEMKPNLNQTKPNHDVEKWSQKYKHYFTDRGEVLQLTSAHRNGGRENQHKRLSFPTKLDKYN